MAIVIAVIDPDPARRAAYLSHVAQSIAPWPGLALGSRARGDMAVLWAAAPNAPVDCTPDGDPIALLIGDALRDDGARMAAAELARIWRSPEQAPPGVLDGLHVGVTLSASGTLVVGADLLGILPVYYWQRGAVTIVASSPEHIQAHPDYRKVIDVEGLAGLLLLGHLFGGRTLVEGIRRLAPGNLFVTGLHGAPREIVQHRIETSRQHYDLPFEALQELLVDGIDQAVRRLAHHPSTALLLSGGRDSRLLGGFLARHRRQVRAITLGRETDGEFRCAREVARTLGFAHTMVDVPSGEYPAIAERMARWEQLAGGFPFADPWGLPDHLESSPPATVTGLVMDAVVGGSHILWAYTSKTRQMSFDAFFERINRLAFPPDAVASLLGDRHGPDAVASVIDRVRSTYAGLGESDAQRAWAFDLLHRQRLFVARTAWPLSFRSWPVIPTVERALLRLCGGMPPSALAGRRLQDAILLDEFPSLAELPLDRNAFDSTPLRPRLRNVLTGHLRYIGRAAGLWSGPTLDRDWERLYYYRTFWVNAPGWMAVRRTAEPLRTRLGELLDPTRLAELLPPADRTVETADMIIDSNRVKLLIGLALWARDHL